MRYLIFVGSYVVCSYVADWIDPGKGFHFMLGAIFGSIIVNIFNLIDKEKRES